MERERGGKEEPATPEMLDKMLSVNDCEFPQFRAGVRGLEWDVGLVICDNLSFSHRKFA